MLNKDICKNCINVMSRRGSPFLEGWTEKDESTWRQVGIVCPAVSAVLEVESKPPYECYYRLEQIMKDEK